MLFACFWACEMAWLGPGLLYRVPSQGIRIGRYPMSGLVHSGGRDLKTRATERLAVL
jgi:hypothetical protein